MGCCALFSNGLCSDSCFSIVHLFCLYVTANCFSTLYFYIMFATFNFYSVCNSLSFVVITSIKDKRSLIFSDSTLMELFYSIALPYFNIFVYGIAVTVFLSVMLYCYSILFFL